jgi:hypothetical protein
MKVLLWPERALRWAMISVGFKELIEKCEEYFGRRATKAVIAILAVCVVLVAIGLAVTASVYPLSLWLAGVVTGAPAANQVIQGLGTGVTVFWIGIAAGLFLRFLRSYRNVEDIRKSQIELKRMLDRAELIEAQRLAKKERSSSGE